MAELKTIFNKFSESHLLLVNKVTKALSFDRYSDVDKVINEAFKKTDYVQEFKKLFTDYLLILTGKTKAWVLGRKLTNDLTISQAVWKNVKKTKQILKNTLKKHLNDFVAWNKVAQEVFKRNLAIRELPKYVDELVQAAKKMDLDTLSTKKFIDYRRKLKHLQRTAPKLSNTRLRKAYLALTKTTEGLSTVTLEKAVKRAVSAKSKYNAERLVRTEMASAYNDTFYENAEIEEIPAYKWTLSAGHKIHDICDYYATVDRYGLGPGVFPIDAQINTPAHPNCMCSLTKIYTLDKKPKYNKTAGKKYVQKNPDVLLVRDQKRASKLKYPEKLIPNYQKEAVTN